MEQDTDSKVDKIIAYDSSVTSSVVIYKIGLFISKAIRKSRHLMSKVSSAESCRLYLYTVIFQNREGLNFYTLIIIVPFIQR